MEPKGHGSRTWHHRGRAGVRRGRTLNRRVVILDGPRTPRRADEDVSSDGGFRLRSMGGITDRPAEPEAVGPGRSGQDRPRSAAWHHLLYDEKTSCVLAGAADVKAYDAYSAPRINLVTRPVSVDAVPAGSATELARETRVCRAGCARRRDGSIVQTPASVRSIDAIGKDASRMCCRFRRMSLASWATS